MCSPLNIRAAARRHGDGVQLFFTHGKGQRHRRHSPRSLPPRPAWAGVPCHLLVAVPACVEPRRGDPSASCGARRGTCGRHAPRRRRGAALRPDCESVTRRAAFHPPQRCTACHCQRLALCWRVELILIRYYRWPLAELTVRSRPGPARRFSRRLLPCVQVQQLQRINESSSERACIACMDRATGGPPPPSGRRGCHECGTVAW
jgi:hypothetical protein